MQTVNGYFIIDIQRAVKFTVCNRLNANNLNIMAVA